VLGALKGLALLGSTIFTDTLIEVCDVSGAEDKDVCTGLIGEQGPIIYKDIKALHLYSAASENFCITLLGLCSYPTVPPPAISFPKPKPATKRPPPSGKPPIKVAHISDTHVDLSYETGASYNCTKPICCRPYDSSDAPGNNAYPAGPWGNHNCDAPLNLETSMFGAINNLNPAFSIFTGDVAAHDIWLVNEAEVLHDLNVTYNNMHTLKAPVYPATGNHDTAPVNAFPPASLGSSVNPQWTYDALAYDWTSWIGSAAAQQADKDGGYAAVYNNKLRVISFNSIFYYTENFYIYAQDPLDPDPSGQFAWLVTQLQAAEDAGQRAWLISHVPTGSSDFIQQYSANFDYIVQRYEATIAALFYGHTHVDQFEIGYSDYKHPSAQNAVSMSYIAPSLTPTSGSPAFRVYSIDPVTFGVLDFTSYYANINSSTYQSQGPNWQPLYSAKQAYGSLVAPAVTDPAAELTPAFWHNVTVAFEANDAAFQQYVARKSRDYDLSTCTGSCKTLEICGLRAAQSQYNCVTPTPGLHLGKRALHDEAHAAARLGKRDAWETEVKREARAHRDECEGSRIKHVFRRMMADQNGFRRMVDEGVVKRNAVLRG
jgi:sphingomyelin phosphodiesterase